jgi:tetratricopeptide (TPR) repeat protein
MTGQTRLAGRRSAALLAGLCFGVCMLGSLSGCSGGPVGASYEAERACWAAGRMEQRLGLRPQAKVDALRPAMRAYERILARYPLAAAGSDPDLRRSLTRSRILAARRLANLLLAGGERARAGQVLWDIQDEAAGDPTTAIDFYGDLLQIMARGGSADSLADSYRAMYTKLPPAQPDGTPLVPVLQAPLGRISTYSSAGRPGEAQAALADALSYYDRVTQERAGTATEAVAWTLKADLLARSGRVPEAVTILERARSLPAAGELAPGIGFLLGQFLEQPPVTPGAAARVYREVFRDFPGKPAGLQAGTRLATLLASAGQADSALAILDRVALGNPRDPENAAQARYQKGLVLAASGRGSEAIRELRAVATDFPRTRAGLAAPLQVAEYYRASNDSLAMRATLQEAEQGYELLIADLRSDPAQGPLVMAAIDRLLDVRVRLRDWARLAQLLEERATSFPRDQRSPSALVEAAQVLDERLGDRPGSIRVLQALISRYPTHPLAKAAKDRIARLGGSSGS